MFRIFKFIQPDDETITLTVPKALQGKLVEIVLSEKAPDDDTILNKDEHEQMAHKEAELQMLDKLRNQLSVWDM